MLNPLILLLAALLSSCIYARLNAWDGKDSNYGSPRKVHEEVEAALHNIDPEHGKVTKEDDLFYYFSLHDYKYHSPPYISSSHDGHLDGHEMTFALYLPEDGSVPLSEVENMKAHVFEEDDLDNDGMISWQEYLESQTYHS